MTPLRIVLLCSGEDPRVDDVRACGGLGAALAAAGHAVRVLAPEQWHRCGPADVVVAATPDADPSWALPGAWRVAWVGGDVERWAGAAHLGGFDQVLATSPRSARRLRRETPRAGGVLPRGVDPAAPLVADPVAGDEASVLGLGHLPCAFLADAAAGVEPSATGRLGVRTAGLPEPPYDLGGLQRAVREEWGWDGRAEELLALVGAARADGAGAPAHALHFWPDYTAGNPIQTMMYAALGQVDAYPVAVTGPLAPWLQRRAGSGTAGVLHLHWTSPLLQNCPTGVDALIALRTVLAALESYVGSGGRLVWTVHNVLPHDVRHRWAELELAEWLAAHSALVHVMARSTLAAARPYYRLDPDRVAQVDLSGYEDVYPRWISRGEARRRLGLREHHRVLVAVGGVRAYKGLDRMLDVLAVLADDDPDLRLLIAGQPSGPGIDELRARCEADPRVVSSFGHVADADLQVWMHAADLAVLPYRAILNSGAFTLALGFGLPVVGPASGALPEWRDHDHVRLFDPADDHSLERELRTALEELVRDPARAARAHDDARAASVRLHPQRMAQGLARALAPVLDPGAAAS